jgi:hypothetical protein
VFWTRKRFGSGSPQLTMWSIPSLTRSWTPSLAPNASRGYHPLVSASTVQPSKRFSGTCKHGTLVIIRTHLLYYRVRKSRPPFHLSCYHFVQKLDQNHQIHDLDQSLLYSQEAIAASTLSGAHFMKLGRTDDRKRNPAPSTSPCFTSFPSSRPFPLPLQHCSMSLQTLWTVKRDK